jgi:protein O-GlcNAc transferase
LKAGRNDPCPCGSGEKYKKCCQDKTEGTRQVRQDVPSTAANQTAPTAIAFNALVALFNAGRHVDLESQTRLLLEQYPDSGLLWKVLGAALQAQGKDALAALRRTTELLPDDADAHNNLGNLLRNLKQPEEAAASCRLALSIKPDFAEAHSNLGNALKDLGQLDDAVACYRVALQIKPGYAIAHFNLGNVLRDLEQFGDAVASYRHAVSTDPNFFQAHSNLGNVLLRNLGQLDDALSSYGRAVELQPNLAVAHSNLGNALKEAARLDEAIACFRRAVALNPHDMRSRSNLLFTLSFHPAFDDQAILAEVKQFSYADRMPRFRRANSDARREDLPQPRLRIGYVSPDFRSHCQSLFTMPLLSNHDHAQFEIYCYADLRQPDEVSNRLRSHADVWRSTHSKSDAQMAEMIVEDGIDILVDLTMHMENGRPMLFANKPAPVQVAWLAYPGTTGIPAIDYRLTDPWLDPAELGDDRYTETSIRLPDTFWCYDPRMSAPTSAGLSDLVPNDLPALSSGFITFGCLNNFCKVSDDTLHRWAAVMARVPSSRLILLAAVGQHRRRVFEILAQYEIAAQRIEFVEYRPRAQYLETYHRIDVCLDTLPSNGHTTSLDAYWMGVPVVTQIGRTVVGRAGWSQLNNLGLTELVALDDPAFIDIAVTLATDLPRLAQLRRTLRGRFEASPLMNGKRFATAMEAVYREIAVRSPPIDTTAAPGLIVN